MAKVKTPLGDLLDYLDRVEGRDIHTLSVAKFRERVKERIHLEKERMMRFAKKATTMDNESWDYIFDEVFVKNESLETPDEVEGLNSST